VLKPARNRRARPLDQARILGNAPCGKDVQRKAARLGNAMIRPRRLIYLLVTSLRP